MSEIKYPIREFKAQSKDNRSKIVMPPLKEVIKEHKLEAWKNRATERKTTKKRAFEQGKALR